MTLSLDAKRHHNERKSMWGRRSLRGRGGEGSGVWMESMGSVENLDDRNPPAAPAPVSPLPVANQITNYAILAELGRGSFGAVFEAINLPDRRRCALKWTASAINEESGLDHEVEGLSRCQGCDHVVELYASFALTTRSKIIELELVEGAVLYDYMKMREGDLPQEAEVAKMFHQAAWAVQHCHVNGVAHRE
jgi:serine/threonine protein kinase